ncbi:hypothetical protein D9615_001387 [Tricholomella constricta]|uniref:Uncharacterized protein n=1 Tax=Tricholomella constricta TaxID=117010 RepID=A0A8H5M909_9AGAR|nr:hypothetical protein D9615_001387 [Tricholomella constricta]
MSIVAPAPSGSRGEVILQPNYFTSSIFVKAFRDDITTLIHSYHEQYTTTQPGEPFLLFKALWSSQGWKWLHFMVFDDRTREAFLNVVLRLFLERMVKTEAPYSRVVALFGLYTFYYTQPRGTAPPLHSVTHIPIQLDHLASLKALPDSLNADHLQPLQPNVSRILSVLLKDKVFFVTPHSVLGALSPRDLPREIFVDEGTVLRLDPSAPKKKGRPTRRDKAKKAKLALDNLDRWLEGTPGPLPTLSTVLMPPPLEGAPTLEHPLTSTLRRYHAEKTQILNSIDTQSESTVLPLHVGMTVERANQFVLGRLKAAEGLFSLDGVIVEGGALAGVARVERAVNELGDVKALGRKGGALNLLEGAGKSNT